MKGGEKEREMRRGVGIVALLEVGAACRPQPADSLLCDYACLGSRQDQTESLPPPSVKSPAPTPGYKVTEDVYMIFCAHVLNTSCCSLVPEFQNEKGWMHMSTRVNGSGDTFCILRLCIWGFN